MKFNIDDYKGKYAMHCRTEEEAVSFCDYLDSVGRTWCNGDSYISCTEYGKHKENTCYNFNEGAYCHSDYFKTNDYKILEWSDFMNKEFTKADLKNWDVVKHRNGKIAIARVETGALVFKEGFNKLEVTRNDLTCFYNSEYDIIAVRRPENPCDCQFSAFVDELGDLVYERKELDKSLEEAMDKLVKDFDSSILEFKEKMKKLCDEFNKN